MSKRDRELVREMAQLMDSQFSSPSLQRIGGEWFMLYKEGEKYSYLSPIIVRSLSDESITRYRNLGWTVTPVLVHQVTSAR